MYKGTLPGGGVAIAVKKHEGRLCVGEKQFRNEVRTIGVIQHVNLVRLRGFSSHGSERLLMYECTTTCPTTRWTRRSSGERRRRR